MGAAVAAAAAAAAAAAVAAAAAAAAVICSPLIHARRQQGCGAELKPGNRGNEDN